MGKDAKTKLAINSAKAIDELRDYLNIEHSITVHLF